MVALQSQTIEVSVFPDRARVTRRGTLALAAGVQTIELTDLPLSLVPDSVRAAGRGSADSALLDVNTRRATRAASGSGQSAGRPGRRYRGAVDVRQEPFSAGGRATGTRHRAGARTNGSRRCTAVVHAGAAERGANARARRGPTAPRLSPADHEGHQRFERHPLVAAARTLPDDRRGGGAHGGRIDPGRDLRGQQRRVAGAV